MVGVAAEQQQKGCLGAVTVLDLNLGDSYRSTCDMVTNCTNVGFLILILLMLLLSLAPNR